MKIGILTLSLHQTNYGGLLQAYAMEHMLESLGHEVYVIVPKDYIRPPLWTMPFRYAKRILMNIFGKRTPIFIEHETMIRRKEGPILQQNTEIFVRNYIKTINYKKYSNVKEGEFDAFIVGSDQVWRPIYSPFIRDMYLKFTDNWKVKRIAYAASFGTDKWEYSKFLSIECRKLVKKFDAVSVREDSGVILCKEKFNILAMHVLDPTLLLDVNDYLHLIEISKIPQNNGNLHYYILDETSDKYRLINIIAKEKGLTPFSVLCPTDRKKYSLSDRIQPPVEKWLRAFYDAKFIITDSFHACVFSIIFNKQFIVYANTSRGVSRYQSLLRMFGIENRLVRNSSDYSTIPDINYDDVNLLLKKYKKDSIRFITEALS